MRTVTRRFKRQFSLRRTAAATLAALAIAVLPSLLTTSQAIAGPTEVDGVDRAAQDAYKLAKVREAIDELSSRPTDHLNATQQRNRAALCKQLRIYADRARFAQNGTFPGHAIPMLIDRSGQRCPLAHLIDSSGHGALLMRLAAKKNNCFIRDLMHDKEFAAWLDSQGLTWEEATYVMGPGYIRATPQRQEYADNPGGMVDPGQRTPFDPEPDETDTPDETDSSDDTDAPDETDAESDPSSVVTPPSSVITPPSSNAPTPAARSRPSRRRPTARSASWREWWTLNRFSYINLRSRYHDGVVTTPRDGDSAFRGKRASEAEVNSALIPLFQGIASDKHSRTRATALAAWARTARPAHAADLGAALRAYLRDGNNPYRELLIMKFGTVDHATTQPALREIVLDTKEGRKLLGTKGAIPERMRAFAAIALGHTGKAVSARALMEVLDTKQAAMPDLRSACIMALGVLGKTGNAVERGQATRFLIDNLRAKRWPEASLAMIPTALAATGDVIALSEATTILSRFRHSRIVRQSCALAVGAMAPRMTEPLLDNLIASARRDTDNLVRQFSLIAIGQVAERHPAASEGQVAANEKIENKLHRFYTGCFAGLNTLKRDLPWVYLSSALASRRFKKHAATYGAVLIKESAHSPSKDRREAAIVAAGLMGDKAAVNQLRAILSEGRDEIIMAAAAESLGMLRDLPSREKLRSLVRTHKSAHIQYGAALGLGFLADADSLPSLIDTFEQSRSHASQSSLARIIGEIGDRRAIPRLVEMAKSNKSNIWIRRRALAALGMIGQAADGAKVVRYQRAVNYEQASASMQMVLNLF